MPKEVLRSGAQSASTGAPAASAAATTSSPEIEAKLKTFRETLVANQLDDGLIESAVAKQRAKLESAAKPAPAPTPAKPEPKNVTPAKSPTPAGVPDDDVAAREMMEEAAARDGAPASDNRPENVARAHDKSAKSELAAPDESHSSAPAKTVTNAWSDASDGALSGPINRSDFKTPQLKLVQGNGELSKTFNQGTLIFSDLQLFAPPADPTKPGEPLRFIPVKLRKYFREDLTKAQRDAEPTRQPRNAVDQAEVNALGGSIDWSDDGHGKRLKPSWGSAAELLVLLEKPAGSEHEGFTIKADVEGKETVWAIGLMYLNGGQYRTCATDIIQATDFILCEGSGASRKISLDKRIWQLQAKKEESGENMVWNFKTKMLPIATPPDLREVAAALRRG